jgi:hypothetical protein
MRAKKTSMIATTGHERSVRAAEREALGAVAGAATDTAVGAIADSVAERPLQSPGDG